MPSSVWARCGVLCMAGIGGMMPTLCRLAVTYVTNPKIPLPEIGLYFGLLLFFVIGIAMALGFGERELRQAFVLGIAAPGLITNIVAGASGDSRIAKAPNTRSFLRVPQAVAQTMTPIARGDEGVAAGIILAQAVPRQLGIRFQFNPPSGGQFELPARIDYVLAHDTVLSGSTVSTCCPFIGIIPTGIVAVRVTVGNPGADKRTRIDLPLAPFQRVEMVVEISAEPMNDFWWALGAKRKAVVLTLRGQVLSTQ